MDTAKSKKLTTQQQTIVALEQYPQYLRAGAGTGKTEVLVQKILHILKVDYTANLNTFGVITFTNKATDEMRIRLTENLYREWLNSVHGENADVNTEFIRSQLEITNIIDVCTIHGFCERLLRRHGLIIDLPLNFKVKSFRHETTEAINLIVSQHYNNPLLSSIPQYRISKLLDILLTNNSNHGIVIDEKDLLKFTFNTPENEFWNSFKELYLKIYLEVYKKIQSLKEENNILTPNDLIRKTVELLDNEYAVKKISDEYRYLFIDEFQDTNKDQFDLVNALIKNGVKVFLVGDDKQSIYAFRGADVENSKMMNSLIASISENKDGMSLNENFRTDETLINAINKIFTSNFYFDDVKVSFPVEPLEVPEIMQGTGKSDCVEFFLGEPIVEIIEKILAQSLHNKKIEYGDIAILCRRNFDLDRIATELKEKGYPVEVVGGRGFYKSKEITDIYKLFNAVINKSSEYQGELLFTDYYKAISNNVAGVDFEIFLTELETIFRRETIEEILTFVYERSCVFQYYKHLNNYQAISNLHKLKDISRTLMNKDSMQPLQFLDYLQIMISTGQEEDDADIAEVERENGVIKLYSIHKAKGLAFPVVIVPCIDNKLNRPIAKPKIILQHKTDHPTLAFDSDFISKDFESDKEYLPLLGQKTIEHLEEELRIFYVACTRAKHKLIFSSERTYQEITSTLTWKNYASIAKWLFPLQGELTKIQ